MPANQFVWYELVTSDIDAALSFYGTVIGWEGDVPPKVEILRAALAR